MGIVTKFYQPMSAIDIGHWLTDRETTAQTTSMPSKYIFTTHHLQMAI